MLAARRSAVLLLLLLGACATHRPPPATWSSAAAQPAASPVPGRLALEEEPQHPTGDDHLAKQLTNPVAALISVPFQFNHDDHVGVGDDGDQDLLNIQPVIPFGLSEDWNLISRTIVPLTRQQDLTPTSGTDQGLGDVLQSLFFSPVEPTEGGLIWGVGPAVLLPTASNDKLGRESLALGPTAVALKQDGPWTFGALANHLWSVTGDKDREAVNATFLQPFLSYTTPTAWTTTLNLESTRDWSSDEWTVPANLLVSRVVRLGGQPVSIGVGVRRWLDSPDGAPEGWGYRLQVTLLYPKTPPHRAGRPEDAL